MRDAYDAEMWNRHHDALTARISRFFTDLEAGLTKLNRIQFAAPWHQSARKTHDA